MAKIKIMTDSASDLLREEVEKLDIEMMCIPITIDGVGYYEYKDFTKEAFYKKLAEAKELPTTAQITYVVYADKYKELYEQGYTDIINVTINAKGSNMFEAANHAKLLFFETCPEAEGKINIEVINSGTYACIYGQAVKKAAAMVQNSASPQEVIDYLRDHMSRAQAFFLLTDLEHARRSGRIGGVSAMVGGMLGIRPVMHIVDGAITPTAKVRGDKPALAKVVELYLATVTKKMENPPYTIIYAANRAMAEELAALIQAKVGYPPEEFSQIGAAVTINAGPTLVGVSVIS